MLKFTLNCDINIKKEKSYEFNGIRSKSFGNRPRRIRKENFLDLLNKEELKEFLGELGLNPNKWIRLRTSNEKTTLTVKHILESDSETFLQPLKEIEIEVSSMKEANEFMEAIGFAHKCYLEKRRTTYSLADHLIEVDTWPKIPTYFELEGKNEEDIENVLNLLGYSIKDKNVVVPQMPIGVGNQNFENWSKVLDELKINNNTIIIAHSIAPIFVCNYLITNKIKVKKLIFVCGFNNYLGIDPDFDAVNKPMFIDNLEDVKNYCNNIICFYSDNDPYVKFEVEKSFADSISNEQYIIKNGGHINAENGYTEFEEILKVI